MGGADHSENDRCFPPSEGAPPSELWCYSLMMPDEYYETELMLWQFKEKVSIFACDGYAVYSSEAKNITEGYGRPGFTSRKVNSDLQAEKGGEFGTALNQEIFHEVWKKVVEDGDYADFDW